MNTLGRYALFSCFFLFLSCGENEIQQFDVQISIEPEGSATIEPAIYGPLFPGDSLSITISAAEGYQFEQWTGTINSFEQTITIYGTQDHELTASLYDVSQLPEEVEIYRKPHVDPHPIFAVRLGATSAAVISKEGEILEEYTFQNRLGNDVIRLPNGEFLGIFKPETRDGFTFGGGAGILRRVTADQQTLWEYTIASATELAHHDVILLPNGNVMTLVWEEISTAEAQALGAQTQGPIYLEKLIEIDPSTSQIVWQWRSVDHLVQDIDEHATTYGNIRQHPRKINLNYNAEIENGDWMHANGIVYDHTRDLVFITVNFYDEVWVIDHSTTTAQATGGEGGNYNVGGDLVYRFGNPAAYDSEGPTIFDRVHHPNFSNESHTQMLLFSNGITDEQSRVFELLLPAQLTLSPQVDHLPQIVWQFSDPDLFYRIVSGAVKLPNGNVLICEGDFGFWEINPAGEVVWKMKGYQAGFWRAYATM